MLSESNRQQKIPKVIGKNSPGKFACGAHRKSNCSLLIHLNLVNFITEVIFFKLVKTKGAWRVKEIPSHRRWK